MKAFIWIQHGHKRLHWVAWDEICTPYNEGGLGIRTLKDTVYGLQGKLAWKVYSGENMELTILWGCTPGNNLLRLYGVESIRTSRISKILGDGV